MTAEKPNSVPVPAPQIPKDFMKRIKEGLRGKTNENEVREIIEKAVREWQQNMNSLERRKLEDQIFNLLSRENQLMCRSTCTETTKNLEEFQKELLA